MGGRYCEAQMKALQQAKGIPPFAKSVKSGDPQNARLNSQATCSGGISRKLCNTEDKAKKGGPPAPLRNIEPQVVTC